MKMNFTRFRGNTTKMKAFESNLYVVIVNYDSRNYYDYQNHSVIITKLNKIVLKLNFTLK